MTLPYETEADICKVRGHQPDNIVLTSNPPQNRCKWCRAVYRWETRLVETSEGTK